MRDINKILREAYFTALSTISGVNSYYAMAPDGLIGNYITFRPLNSVPIQQFNEVPITIRMEVVVYTEGKQYNDGEDLDSIVNNVYNVLYPTIGYKLPLGGNCQIMSTTLVSDIFNNWTVKDIYLCMDRTLIFEHKIYLN